MNQTIRGKGGRPPTVTPQNNLTARIERQDQVIQNIQRQVGEIHAMFSRLSDGLLQQQEQREWAGPQLQPSPRMRPVPQRQQPTPAGGVEQPPLSKDDKQRFVIATQQSVDQERQSALDYFSRQPYRVLIVSEPDAFRLRDIYFRLGPAGAELEVPEDVAREYERRRRERLSINQFESRISAAMQHGGGAVDITDEQALDRVLGAARGRSQDHGLIRTARSDNEWL